MNWIEILQNNLPGAEYSVDNAGTDQEKYDSLLFYDGTVKPLYTQIVEWQREYEVEQNKTEYQRLRRAEYPPQEELLFAIWEKDIEGRPEYAVEVEARRQAVKRKYSKPTR